MEKETCSKLHSKKGVGWGGGDHYNREGEGIAGGCLGDLREVSSPTKVVPGGRRGGILQDREKSFHRDGKEEI